MESISRISSLLESARDLTLDAAQAARNARGSSKAMPAAQIKKLLDSRNDRDILDGLRRVISMMYRTQPVLPFFSSVVKNVASPQLEIKKLVYIYLVAYAEAEPDLALLSINTIQKSLSDSNPQVRALALKTMSGIRVPVISQIVSLAIKKGLGDMSPLVRKAAALAIPKCYRLDPNTLPQLLEYISTLLGDKQYYVAGAAVMAFLDVCPDKIDLVHKHYRALVKKVVDMDEWSQLATLRLMTFYARRCFPRRMRKITKSSGSKGFYGDEEDEDNDKATHETSEMIEVVDPDLDLLLRTIKPLLQSRNSAVVVAVARCYTALGSPEYTRLATGPLVALLRGPQDIQQVALYSIVSVCLTHPADFVRYASHFLIKTLDPPQVWQLKLELLVLLFPHCDAYKKSLLLHELEHFSQAADRDLVRESVRAIGRCAQSDSRTSARCMRLLLKQIASPDGNLVAESLTVIRHLIQQDPEANVHTVIRLAKNLDTASDPRARASIIWLVGEFAGIDAENNIAPDVLRILAKGFADEAEPAKLQIVLLAAKVYLHYLNRSTASMREDEPKSSTESTHQDLPSEDDCFDQFDSYSKSSRDLVQQSDIPDHPIVLLWNYILLLARYDTSYDLRDRTRLYRALLATPTATQLANLMLFAPKPVPQTPSPFEGRTDFVLGSASMIIGDSGGIHGLPGYESLPDWVEAEQEPDPSLREVDVALGGYDEKRVVTAGEMLDSAVRSGKMPVPLAANAVPKNNGNAKDKTLDDWLAEDEGDEASSEEEEEDSDEESSEEDDDEGSSEETSEADEETDVDERGEHDSLVR